MSVRTYKRLAALVFVLSFCLASAPAFADRIDESGSLAPSIGGSHGGFGVNGDPDRTNGCNPPQLSKTQYQVSFGNAGGGSSGSRAETLWSALSHWFAGLLQRNGYRY